MSSEASGTRVGLVEVALGWRGESRDEACVEEAAIGLRGPSSLTIGSAASSRFVLPIETMERTGREALRLVERGDEGFQLRVPRGAEFVLERAGECVALEPALREDRLILLERDHAAELRLGDVTLHVRASAAPTARFRRFRVDAWAWAAALVALSLHVGLLGALDGRPTELAAPLTPIPSSERLVQACLAPTAPASAEDVEGAGSATMGAIGLDAPSDVGNDTPAPLLTGGPGELRGSARREPRALRPSIRRPPSEVPALRGDEGLASLAGMIHRVSGASDLVYGNPAARLERGGPGLFERLGGEELDGTGGLVLRDAGRGTCVGPTCGGGTVAVGALRTSGDVGPIGGGDQYSIQSPASRVSSSGSSRHSGGSVGWGCGTVISGAMRGAFLAGTEVGVVEVGPPPEAPTAAPRPRARRRPRSATATPRPAPPASSASAARPARRRPARRPPPPPDPTPREVYGSYGSGGQWVPCGGP